VFSQIKTEELKNGVIKYYRVGVKKETSFVNYLENVQNYFFSTKPFDKTVAFLVGVSKYDNMQDLPKVSIDIDKLRIFLLEKGGVDTVFIAKDEIVNDEMVKWYMTFYFPETLGSNDRLIFYFSGHAADNKGQTGYLLFKNSQTDEFWRNAVAISETYEWSKVNKVKHLLFLYDCCSSGLAFNSKGMDDDYEKVLTTLSGKGSRIVITAGDANQKTYDGWFTTSFLNAMNNNSKDIFITAHDIYCSIRNDIINLSAKHGKDLTPRIWELGSFNGTFIFVNPNKVNGQLKLGQNVYLKSKGKEDERFPISNSLPDILNQIGEETNKLILCFHPTIVNLSQYNWANDLFKYSIEEYLKSNNKILIFNDSTFRNFQNDFAKKNLLYNHIKELSIEADSIIIKTEKITSGRGGVVVDNYIASLNAHIILNHGSINEEKRNFSLSQESSDKTDAINSTTNKFIEYLDGVIMENIPNTIPKVINKNRNSIRINKGFKQSFYGVSIRDVIDSASLKHIGVVKIKKINKDSSELSAVYGLRMIKKGDLIRDRLKPFRGNIYLEFRIGQSKFNSINNSDINSLHDQKVDNFQISANYLFSAQFLNPFIGLRFEWTRNNSISLFGLGPKIGINYDLIHGFVKSDFFFESTIFLSNHQELPDSNKLLIANYISIEPSWVIDNNLSGNIALNNSIGINLKYIIDRAENFQFVTNFGFSTTTPIRKWMINYHTKEEDENGHYKDSKDIKIPDEYIPMPIIFQTNFFWSLGIEYHFH